MTQVFAADSDSAKSAANVRPAAAQTTHRTGFGEFLSELNPLQYVPVIGTIYRALTGDRVSEEARTVGSLVVSGMIGGPVGVAISAAEIAVEKAIGIDPEKLGTRVLAAIGIGGARPDAMVAATHQPARSEPSPDNPAVVRTAAWSTAQLAAYGVTTAGTGSLKQGSLEGCDVLNSLELARLGLPNPASGTREAATAGAAASM